MLDTLKTTLELNNPGLLREQAYVNGEWISAPDGKTFGVTNPADGTLVASVPQLGVAMTRRRKQQFGCAEDGAVVGPGGFAVPHAVDLVEHPGKELPRSVQQSCGVGLT